MKPLHEVLLSEIDAFLARHGMAASRFGALAMGDHRFVFTLRRGSAPRTTTVDRVRAFMRDYRPKRRR